MFVLIGESGCGKMVFFKLIMGIVCLMVGDVLFDGFDLY